jgi:hypothetical protein
MVSRLLAQPEGPGILPAAVMVKRQATVCIRQFQVKLRGVAGSHSLRDPKAGKAKSDLPPEGRQGRARTGH